MGKKIRNAARGQECTLRLDGCARYPDTVILAHLPSRKKGMGIKSPDWWSVFACHLCHDAIDRRRPTAMSRELILERLLAGVFETHEILIRQGLLSYDDD